jgi:hypothetical protein
MRKSIEQAADDLINTGLMASPIVNSLRRAITHCPNGHGSMSVRCVADSDDRIYSTWRECATCGWRASE